jgi:hypothetical protein
MKEFCSYSVVQLCSCAVVQSCSHAVVQSCSHAVVQSCSRAVVQSKQFCGSAVLQLGRHAFQGDYLCYSKFGVQCSVFFFVLWLHNL